jgi:hypothetical protein
MNAYTAALLALQTPQQRFRRELVQSLVEYIDCMRKQNKELRDNQTPFTDDALPDVIETGELGWLTQ